MVPSSLMRCNSSSKTSSSSGWMYLLRGGWGSRLCWNAEVRGGLRARVHQGSHAYSTRWHHGPHPMGKGPVPDPSPRQVAHWSPGKAPGGGAWELASLTSSLTSRRMEGWSSMALKRVPTTQHFSPGCSSHSFFTRTPLPGHKGPELRDQVALLAPPQGTETGLTQRISPGTLSPSGGRDHGGQGSPRPKDCWAPGQRDRDVDEPWTGSFKRGRHAEKAM